MVAIENGPVADHLQALADEAHELLGCRFTTYNGHSPDRTLALDCWDTNKDLDALADFARANHDRFGVDYVIWRQRIWNPEIRDDWRYMADRGSVTANHFDHLHLSAEATGSARPKVGPSVSAPVALTIIAIGDKGPVVRYLQERLSAHGHDVAIDGDFGPHTKARVQIHQSAWRLVPDGIVGPVTWPTLQVSLV